MKKYIIKILRNLGLEIKKRPFYVSGVKIEHNFFHNHKWIQPYNFHTILDIGANQGQFATKFRLLFPNSKIYSFEPIPEVFNLLSERFKADLKFKAFNFGLGLEKGEFDFFQNDFSDSSSLLPMKELHVENFPKTKDSKKIRINVEKLDEIALRLELVSPILIKIDVQGFERMVILGGEETIKKAKMIIVEVSFFELYENQFYFDSIYALLHHYGFRFIGNIDQLKSPKDGLILQADAIFLNQRISD